MEALFVAICAADDGGPPRSKSCAAADRSTLKDSAELTLRGLSEPDRLKPKVIPKPPGLLGLTATPAYGEYPGLLT